MPMLRRYCENASGVQASSEAAGRRAVRDALSEINT